MTNTVLHILNFDAWQMQAK